MYKIIFWNLILIWCLTQTESQVRLQGGQRPSRGRVEIFHNGTWGTICDDDFDNNAAAVVCQMLNFTSKSAVVVTNDFGTGVGQIWLDDVICYGTENTILDCSHAPWGNHNCDHTEDVGIDCIAGLVRLQGGQRPSQGRVEIFYNGIWGTICDNGFDNNAAAVVCRMLNFTSENAVVVLNAYFGTGAGQIWLDEVNCSGAKETILECSYKPWGHTNCNHNEDVGVDCNAVEGQVHLLGGQRPSQGRVGIFHNGIWGTICHDNFDINAAVIVCKMLNFTTKNVVIAPRSSSYFGSGNGYIWLDDVTCIGTEKTLLDCLHSPWGINDCNHDKDVGVDCNADVVLENHQIRLSGGRQSSQGRVEIFHNGTWGTICKNAVTNSNYAAFVICGMLNFTSQQTTQVLLSDAYFGPGVGQIWLEDLFCFGREQTISACYHNNFGQINDCNHDSDLSVECNAEICIPGSYFDTNDLTCKRCTRGTYQKYYRQKSCNICPGCTTTYFLGATECTDICPAGKEFNFVSQLCEDCYEDYYTDRKLSDFCIACPPGTGNHAAGSTSCFPFEETTLQLNNTINVKIMMQFNRLQLNCSNTTARANFLTKANSKATLRLSAVLKMNVSDFQLVMRITYCAEICKDFNSPMFSNVAVDAELKNFSSSIRFENDVVRPVESILQEDTHLYTNEYATGEEESLKISVPQIPQIYKDGKYLGNSAPVCEVNDEDFDNGQNECFRSSRSK